MKRLLEQPVHAWTRQYAAGALARVGGTGSESAAGWDGEHGGQSWKWEKY